MTNISIFMVFGFLFIAICFLIHGWTGEGIGLIIMQCANIVHILENQKNAEVIR